MAARKKRDPDPPAQLRELARVLEGGLARGYVFRGEERYFRDQGYRRVREAAEACGMEICTHDAEAGSGDFRLASLIDDLSGGGLFAARRLVCIRNAGSHLKKLDGKSSPLARAIAAFVSNPEDTGVVCLSEASLRADHESVKAIQKAGGVVLTLRKLWDSPPPWSPDPRQAEVCLWTRSRAQELGVPLSPEAAVYLCAAVSGDLFAIDDELERLRGAPAGELRSIVGWNAATAPWTVAEHLVAGDLARGLAGVETLFRGGFQEKSGRRLLDPTALATMLTASVQRNVRQGLHVSEALSSGASEKDALSRAGVSGAPTSVKKILERAKRRSPRAWEALLVEAADLERRAKFGAGLSAEDFSAFALRWAVGGERRTSRQFS